jgi:hypothetical protein
VRKSKESVCVWGGGVFLCIIAFNKKVFQNFVSRYFLKNGSNRKFLFDPKCLKKYVLHSKIRAKKDDIRKNR